MRSGSQEGHLAVRGNIFSFLLPWEKILAQLFQKIEDGDLSEWPLSPDVVRQIVRVRLVHISIKQRALAGTINTTMKKYIQKSTQKLEESRDSFRKYG